MLINVCFVILLSFDAAKLLCFFDTRKENKSLFAHTSLLIDANQTKGTTNCKFSLKSYAYRQTVASKGERSVVFWKQLV